MNNIPAFSRDEQQALQPKWYEKSILRCENGTYTLSHSCIGIAQLRELFSPVLKKCGFATYVVLPEGQKNILAGKSITLLSAQDTMNALKATYKNEKDWFAFLKQVGEGKGIPTPDVYPGCFQNNDIDVRRGHAQILSLCNRAVATRPPVPAAPSTQKTPAPAAAVPAPSMQKTPAPAAASVVGAPAPSTHSKMLFDAVHRLGLAPGGHKSFGPKIPKVGPSQNGIYIEVYDNKNRPVHITIHNNGTVERFDGFFAVNNGLTNRRKMDPNDRLLEWIGKQISSQPASATGIAGPGPVNAASTPSLVLQHPTQGPYVPFYKTGQSEFLGNFVECPQGVTMNRIKYKNSEAAFQCEKFLQTIKKAINIPPDPRAKRPTPPMDLEKVDSQLLQEAFAACDGDQAFELKQFLEGIPGKHRSLLPDSYFGAFYALAPQGWKNGGRDDAMWNILQAKFSQNPDLMLDLQRTKPAYLLEHNQVKGRDTYWSDDKDGAGANMLGRMLMCIRERQPLSSLRALNPGEITGFANDFETNHQRSYPIW